MIAGLVSTPLLTHAATQPVLTGLYNAYSPEVFADPQSRASTTRLIVGGWVKESDIGADVMYSTTLKNGKAGKLKRVFTYKGYHANDPSVVQNPLKPKELLMFFTALKNSNATAEQMMKTNWVAVARSTDGGKKWKNTKVVIGQNNGFDTRGAWSPSAIVVGTEIWVYYHTNQPGAPDIYRTKLNAKTLKIIGTEPVTVSGARLSGINVDVEYYQGQYHMLLGASLQDNYYYTSKDGLRWELADTAPFLHSEAGKSIITPTFVSDKNGLSVYYSMGPTVSGANYRYDSVYSVTAN